MLATAYLNGKLENWRSLNPDAMRGDEGNFKEKALAEENYADWVATLCRNQNLNQLQ